MNLKLKAVQIRKDIVTLVHSAGTGHIGGDLSVTDILVDLYYKQMHVGPELVHDPNRDRFVLSKGHSVEALYSVLADKGYFSREELHKTYSRFGSKFIGHPNNKVNGVEMNTGSLGHGLAVGVGMALAGKMDGRPYRVYVVLGDGEMEEGSNWEAITAGAHYKLDNLTFILDNNGLQIDGSNNQVMSLGDIPAKFAAFGFHVIEVKDGNDMRQVLDALDQPAEAGKPTCMICHTTKGKGVSYMENQAGWHGKAPNEEQRAQALKELEA